ncbi:MAG: TadE/TadG family type IV pilus assembly protein [Sphingobium sp.]
MTGAAFMPRWLKALFGNRRGATIVEFAIVAPVLLMILMALFDTGYYLYARAILSGEMQAAGRSSALESASEETQEDLDDHVTAAVQRVVPHGALSFTRMAYGSYERAQAKAEPFIDANGNGICDDGELFEDTNNNDTYDLDGGLEGQGNARDVTIYTATLRYDRLFPLAHMLGWSNQVAVSSSTLLRNQPYDKQSVPPEGTCP